MVFWEKSFVIIREFAGECLTIIEDGSGWRRRAMF